VPEITQDTKVALFSLCQQYVQQRIDTARQAMEAAQEAANSESKSSAGDKYETGRAMAQLERDRNAQLLAGALQLERDLQQVMIDKTYESVQPGSIATTNLGVYFISIGAGKLLLDDTTYFAVSAGSPIAIALAGRKVGEVATFNKLTYEILEVV
jgi:transcription elongation GreA/GreB family factor